MKIMLIIPLQPWYKGGVEKVAKEYSKELQKNNEITIVCTNPKLQVGLRKTIWMNITVIECKGYGGILRISPKLVAYIRKNAKKYDFLVIHNYSTLLPAQILWFKRKIKISIVFTPHYHAEGSTLPLKLFRIMYDELFKKLLVKRIDAIQFVSRTEKVAFERRFGKTKLSKVIYNGIDGERFKKIRKERMERNETKEKILLYVGRLEKYKNVEFVIRALKHLSEEYTLVIIGTGPYKEKLKRMAAEYKVENRVRFLGSVTDKEYGEWMVKAAIFVQPSKIESFGLTSLEAIAAGVKCIVNTEAYGLREIEKKFPNNIAGIGMTKGNERELNELVENYPNETIFSEKILKLDWRSQSRKIQEFYQKVLKK